MSTRSKITKEAFKVVRDAIGSIAKETKVKKGTIEKGAKIIKGEAMRVESVLKERGKKLVELYNKAEAKELLELNSKQYINLNVEKNTKKIIATLKRTTNGNVKKTAFNTSKSEIALYKLQSKVKKLISSKKAIEEIDDGKLSELEKLVFHENQKIINTRKEALIEVLNERVPITRSGKAGWNMSDDLSILEDVHAKLNNGKVVEHNLTNVESWKTLLSDTPKDSYARMYASVSNNFNNTVEDVQASKMLMGLYDTVKYAHPAKMKIKKAMENLAGNLEKVIKVDPTGGVDAETRKRSLGVILQYLQGVEAKTLKENNFYPAELERVFSKETLEAIKKETINLSAIYHNLNNIGNGLTKEVTLPMLERGGKLVENKQFIDGSGFFSDLLYKDVDLRLIDALPPTHSRFPKKFNTEHVEKARSLMKTHNLSEEEAFKKVLQSDHLNMETVRGDDLVGSMNINFDNNFIAHVGSTHANIANILGLEEGNRLMKGLENVKSNLKHALSIGKSSQLNGRGFVKATGRILLSNYDSAFGFVATGALSGNRFFSSNMVQGLTVRGTDTIKMLKHPSALSGMRANGGKEMLTLLSGKNNIYMSSDQTIIKYMEKKLKSLKDVETFFKEEKNPLLESGVNNYFSNTNIMNERSFLQSRIKDFIGSEQVSDLKTIGSGQVKIPAHWLETLEKEGVGAFTNITSAGLGIKYRISDLTARINGAHSYGALYFESSKKRLGEYMAKVEKELKTGNSNTDALIEARRKFILDLSNDINLKRYDRISQVKMLSHMEGMVTEGGVNSGHVVQGITHFVDSAIELNFYTYNNFSKQGITSYVKQVPVLNKLGIGIFTNWSLNATKTYKESKIISNMVGSGYRKLVKTKAHRQIAEETFQEVVAQIGQKEADVIPLMREIGYKDFMKAMNLKDITLEQYKNAQEYARYTNTLTEGGKYLCSLTGNALVYMGIMTTIYGIGSQWEVSGNESTESKMKSFVYLLKKAPIANVFTPAVDMILPEYANTYFGANVIPLMLMKRTGSGALKDLLKELDIDMKPNKKDIKSFDKFVNEASKWWDDSIYMKVYNNQFLFEKDK